MERLSAQGGAEMLCQDTAQRGRVSLGAQQDEPLRLASEFLDRNKGKLTGGHLR